MGTWLHDVEVYAALAEGDPGPARDWGTTRLALAAPTRFVAFPEDERCHDVVLAAGPPRAVGAVEEALRKRVPCPAGLANAAAAIGMYGLLPEDTEPLAEALRAAIRGDGGEADTWLAYGLSMLGAIDAKALTAAAKAESTTEWILPVLVLSLAEGMGAVDDAAAEIAEDVHRSARRDPGRFLSLLVALGVPLGALAVHMDDEAQAIAIGAALAHQRPPEIRFPPGSGKRRQQHAVRVLLDGVPGRVAALVRAVYAKGDPRPEWHLWPLAVAAWLRAQHHADAGHGDAIHDVLHHGGGGDPRKLSAARRSIGPGHRGDVLDALSHHPDVPAALLAIQLVRETGDTELADGVLRMHGGDPDTNLRVAALACVAGFHHPDAVPALLAHADPRKRTLGLVVAEWVPTTEVLEALLAMPVPADPEVRRQYARALAAMADPAVVPHLETLVAADEDHELDEPRALAEALLHVPIGRGAE